MKKSILKYLGFSAIVLTFIFSWITNSVKAGSDFIYVEADYSGTEDGSSSKPFNKIQEALDEARDENKDVYVREGDYEENLKVWEGVEIHGSDRDEVEIKADDSDDPVIKMYDDTEIHHLTIKDGQYGVLVNDGSKAYIGDCEIVDNEDDGIYAEEAKTNNDNLLEIRDSIIADNGWDGIYVEKRKFSIKNNEIYGNDKDGVEFEKGSEGVFEDNKIKDNDGVGLRVTVDKSELYIKDNTFRSNDKSGLEVGAEGTEGLIYVNYKNKFYENKKYGIVRVERTNFSGDQWNRSLKIEAGARYWSNILGEISNLIKVY